MARKCIKAKPDPDGYLRTGIYRKYIGKPKPEHRLTPEKAKAWVEEMNAPVSKYLARIRKALGNVILPHVDGPLTKEQVMQPVVDAGCYSFDIGDGLKLYRDNAELDQQEQCVIDAFRDAVGAIGEIRLIEQHLGPKGQPQFLFRATYRLGQLCERISIRPFEHAAKIGREKIGHAETMREKKTEADQQNRADKLQRASEAIQTASKQFPGDLKRIKKRAAEALEISTRQLQRWLGGK